MHFSLAFRLRSMLTGQYSLMVKKWLPSGLKTAPIMMHIAFKYMKEQS